MKSQSPLSPAQLAARKVWSGRFNPRQRGVLLTTFVQLGIFREFLDVAAEGALYNDAIKRVVATNGRDNQRVMRIDLADPASLAEARRIDFDKIEAGTEIAHAFNAKGVTAVGTRRIGTQFPSFNDCETALVIDAMGSLKTPDGTQAVDTRFLGDTDITIIRVGDTDVKALGALIVMGYYAPTGTFLARTVSDGNLISISASSLVANPASADKPVAWSKIAADPALKLSRIGPFNEHNGQLTAPASGTFSGARGNGQIGYDPIMNNIGVAVRFDSQKPYVVTAMPDHTLMTYDGSTLELAAGGDIDPHHRTYAGGRPTRMQRSGSAQLSA